MLFRILSISEDLVKVFTLLSMTAQEAFDNLLAYTGDDDFEKMGLFYSWMTSINTGAYKIMYKLNPVSYLTTKTFTTVVDTTEYSFEDIDIEDFHSIRTSGCGVFIVEDGIITDELKETEFGSYTAGYWIGNNTLNITPSPSVATTFTIRYIPTITKIESLTDDLVIPDEYLELVTEELKVRYDKQDEEFDIMQVSDSFAKRYESKLLGDEKYSPSNIQDIRTDFAFRSSFHRI